MIEVFKTNVKSPGVAERVLSALHARYPLYMANFDLADCDHVLRVKSLLGDVSACDIMQIVQEFGYTAEVMEDYVLFQ